MIENDIDLLCNFILQGVCTEAGMYALRERRVHVTQEDFELAVAKVRIEIDGISCCKQYIFQVMQKDSEKNVSLKKLWK